MKLDGKGQAAIFEGNDFTKLTAHTPGEAHRLAFQIAYYTAARMGEVVRLPVCCVFGDSGKPLPEILFPSEITKDQETRSVPVNPTLRSLLERYYLVVKPTGFYLFAGMFKGKRDPEVYLRFQTVYLAMQRAIKNAGLQDKGYSCHSFRRSALTKMAAAGIALSTIQKISGHADLKNLQLYLEVSPQQMIGAISCL